MLLFDSIHVGVKLTLQTSCVSQTVYAVLIWCGEADIHIVVISYSCGNSAVTVA